ETMFFEILERRRLLAAGDLDLTFGTNGAVTVPGVSGDSDNPGVVAAGSDQFFVAGVSALHKRDADGNPVNTFGGDGTVALPFTRVISITPLAGGKILVLGTTQVTLSSLTVDSEDRLIRLNADGSVDSTFGTNGVVDLDDVIEASSVFP